MQLPIYEEHHGDFDEYTTFPKPFSPKWNTTHVIWFAIFAATGFCCSTAAAGLATVNSRATIVLATITAIMIAMSAFVAKVFSDRNLDLNVQLYEAHQKLIAKHRVLQTTRKMAYKFYQELPPERQNEIRKHPVKVETFQAGPHTKHAVDELVRSESGVL